MDADFTWAGIQVGELVWAGRRGCRPGGCTISRPGVLAAQRRGGTVERRVGAAAARVLLDRRAGRATSLVWGCPIFQRACASKYPFSRLNTIRKPWPCSIAALLAVNCARAARIAAGRGRCAQ